MKLVLILLLVVLVGLALIFHTEFFNFTDSVMTARATQAYLDAGDYDAAISRYLEAVKDHPTNHELALTLADLYVQKGNLDKASEAYQDILHQDSDDLKAQLGYAALLGQQPEKMNKALDIYRKLFKENVDSPVLMMQIADVFRQAADNPAENRTDMKHWLYDWAIYYYRIASRLNPHLYSAHFNLAVVYQENKQLEKSAMRYCNALLLNPKSYAARYNLGLLLIDLGNYDQAYREMNEAVHLLSDTGASEEAQSLAEQVQTVKNMVFNANNGTAFNGATQTLAGINPACLVPSAPVAQ